MITAVIIAVSGRPESDVAAVVNGQPELTVSRRCADLTEALAAAHAGVGSVAVVSDQPQLDRSVVADFMAAGVAVVGVATGPESAERLAGVGIHAVVDVSDSVEGITDSIMAAAHEAPGPEVRVPPVLVNEDGPEGIIVAVWGPTGAPGRTTIASNLAAECGDLTGNALVVDVDTYGGAVAQALGLLDEAPGIAALARGSLAGTLSHELIARHALSVAPGLRVLSGITRADRWPELSAAALEPLWPMLRRHAAVTVVDCGFGIERDEELVYDTKAPQRNAATLSALAAADAVVVVGSAEPLGIQRLVQAVADLAEVSMRDAVPQFVVVNRVRSSVAGARPEEAVADALRQYGGVEEVWTVPADWRHCDISTLAGDLLPARAPRSPVRKAIRALAQAVVDRVGGSRQPVGAGQGLGGTTSRVTSAQLTD